MNPFIELFPVKDVATLKLGINKFLRQATGKGVTTILSGVGSPVGVGVAVD